MTTTRIRRHYDQRLRRLVQQTGDAKLAVQNGVPRSTVSMGFIERQVGHIATGALIGVQIKSGDSSQRTNPEMYSFRSDRAHFETLPELFDEIRSTVKRRLSRKRRGR